ncbi:MAG: response regulator transcription factor [Eubacterium sp.]|nr:response regulator transcription factor [Eubacterium sp.]
MYSVLIADDEKIIRMGLCSIIDWNSAGFNIIGEAANGSEALEFIKNNNPDVVMIDIRMPKLQGLDALKQAREEGFTGKVIVLSGYSDFEYARTAMRFNTVAYLTKPVDTDELLSVLSKIKTDLDQERQQEENHSSFMSKARKTLLRSFLTGELSLSDNEKNDLNLNHPSYQVIFYEKYSNNISDISYSLSDLLRVANQNEREIESIDIDGNNVILLKGNHPIEKLKLLLDKYSNELPPEKNSPLDSIFISCGSIVNTVDDIPVSYAEALQLLKHRFFSDQNQHTLIYPDDLKKLPDGSLLSSENTGDTATLRENIINSYTSLLVNNIQVFNRNKIAVILKYLQDTLYNAPFTINEEKNLLVDLYLHIKEELILHYNQSDIPFIANSEALSFIMDSLYLYEIVLFLAEQFDKIMESIGYSSRDSIIDDVIYYIGHNYQTNITLENIAPLFGYNSSYLGKIFNKKMGVNFNTYLDSVRVDNAKNILINTKNQVYKVAEMVGYKNVDYFHIKFKKHTGMSPAEFRKHNTEE